MKTILKNIGYKVVHQKIANPEFSTALLSYIEKYENNLFPEWFMSIFHQSEMEDSPFSIYDAYGCFCIHAEFSVGNIMYAEIHLGEKPSSDYRIEEMNEKLQKLWLPFSGEFWGGNQNEDGSIFIAQPVELSVIDMYGREKITSVDGHFPLEVGTTNVFKTLAYLNSGTRRLARWPYNSEKIYLLIRCV